VAITLSTQERCNEKWPAFSKFCTFSAVKELWKSVKVYSHQNQGSFLDTVDLHKNLACEEYLRCISSGRMHVVTGVQHRLKPVSRSNELLTGTKHSKCGKVSTVETLHGSQQLSEVTAGHHWQQYWVQLNIVIMISHVSIISLAKYDHSKNSMKTFVNIHSPPIMQY